jgi:hypothetical protein
MSAGSGDVVSMAQAEIAAITEAWRDACVERDALRRENTELRCENAELKAILARSKTSLAEKFNDPMQDGGSNA